MSDQTALIIRNAMGGQAAAPDLPVAAGELLQISHEQKLADGFYLYRVDGGRPGLALIGFCGLPAGLNNPLVLGAGDRARHWLLSLSEPTQVGHSAWRDWRFTRLPEFGQNRYESAMAVPLAGGEARLSGILTAAKLASGGFTADEVAALRRLAKPLETLLAAAWWCEESARLKSELRRVTDRLAGRNQIDRAKRIIQARHGWTEEEAYMHLRRLSRKSRTPMRDIARSVVAEPTSSLTSAAN